MSIKGAMDYFVLSHLRWNFVFQRPQHLMTRCAKSNRVFFCEEPFYDAQTAFLDVQERSPNLHVVVPHLPSDLSSVEMCDLQELLLGELLSRNGVRDRVLWYYTPMALHFTRNFDAAAVVYDCMDELSGFRGAPAGLRAAERELFGRADLVFTGGQSLYQSKKRQHRSVHCFPSSIDREFFGTARRLRSEPEDQMHIPHPRLGYCGVIDERMDLDLIGSLADARPDWQIVMIGPVVKIDESELPRRSNIHYLGMRRYQELPSYLSGWDAGLLPFAQNESTRFISPTKTPEYLAAGLPVVATSIRDVVDPYGTEGLVEIADTAKEFLAGVERAIASRTSPERLKAVDRFLRTMSWDSTWNGMDQLISEIAGRKRLRQFAPAGISAIPDSFAAD
jgi:UDP-galactopyranose mutase